MRKFYFVIMLAILIQACAGTPGSFSSASTPVPIVATATSTPTASPTFTTTPTITPSPTIVHLPTFDPFQATATGIPIPIFIGKSTAAPFVPPTPSGPGQGFLSVVVSENSIHWGVCQPNKTKIVTKVENPEDVFSVIIFVQVKSAIKEDSTPWTTGNTMQKHGDGTFSYTLAANTTRGHNHYKKSWILFQLVATNDMGEVIGRTRIFSNDISLTPCL